MLELRRQLPAPGKPEHGHHAWAYWHIHTDTGHRVGLITEEHQWLDSHYGPATYGVSHNPSLQPGAARWSSHDHPTPQDALAALADHLARTAHG